MKDIIQNQKSIDSMLGENDFLNEPILSESNKINESPIQNSKTINASFKEITSNNAKTIIAPKKENQIESKPTIKKLDYSWVVHSLAGVATTLIVQYVAKEIKSNKQSKIVESNLIGIEEEPRKKSRLIEEKKENQRDKNFQKPKQREEEKKEIEHKTNSSIPRTMIEQNQFSEIEFATIHQDFLMTIVQFCNETNMKLLILNANERIGTIRVQFLYDRNNSYAPKAIATIQKMIAVQNEYYYFN